MSSFNWVKNATKEASVRRVAIPVNEELDKLIAFFKDQYPEHRFSDTKVIKTFVEAGARQWAADLMAQRKAQQAES